MANPSSAPSGPDVARQIAEQAREHWIEVGKLRERALMTRSPKTCDGLLEMAKREDSRAGSLLARALADARREGEQTERDALKAWAESECADWHDRNADRYWQMNRVLHQLRQRGK